MTDAKMKAAAPKAAPSEAPRHPAQREDVENWITDFGASFTFDPNVDPKKIDFERSLQNQARINAPLSDTTVEVYTEAMERGDIFPASILYWNMGKLLAVDGNHRLKAKLNTGKPIEAYILAKDTKPQTTMLMTFEANAKHGLPNSVEERTEHAMTLMAAGAKKEDAAVRLNLTKAQVTRRWDNLKSTNLAQQAGITSSDWSKLSVGNQNRLGAVREVEVFKKAALLAIRAQLSTTETNSLVTEINKIRGMKDQLEYLDTLYAVYSERIQNTGGGALANPRAVGGWQSPKARLALALTNTKRLTENYLGDDLYLLIRGIHQAELPRYVTELRDQATAMTLLADEMEKARDATE